MKKVIQSGDPPLPLAEYKTLKPTVDAMRKKVGEALAFQNGQEIYEVTSLSSFLDVMDKMDKELVEKENKGSSAQLVTEVTQGLNRMGVLIALLEGELKGGAHKSQWDDLDNRMEQLTVSLPKLTLEEYKTQQGTLHATKKELWERDMWNGLERIDAEKKARGTVDKFVACIEEMDKKVGEEEKKGSMVEGK
ncbi:hypothetical protein H0H93_004332 [Arthromyces matolae]|nr:hypothetical protein H0H93_004332 [Arthromyces matolae]